MKKWIVLFFVASLVVACASGSKMQPGERDLAMATQKVPGITINELKEGYKLYVENCSGCHQLHKPDEFTGPEWRAILPEMFSRVNGLADSKKNLIKDYVIAKSK